jgi:hypothetical protein
MDNVTATTKNAIIGNHLIFAAQRHKMDSAFAMINYAA